MRPFKHKLYLDTETYCEEPINRGTDVYARSAEIMITTYAIDDEPVKCWDVTADGNMPSDLASALEDDDAQVIAHNAVFDRNVIRYDWGIELPMDRWYCTMVQALSHSLPAGLGDLGDVLGIEAKKHDNGRQLIFLFCKPQPKNQKLRRATRETHPKEWQQFLDYAIADTEGMRQCHKRMPTRNYVGLHLEHYHLDQVINDRGMCMDIDFAEAAVELLKAEKKKHNAKIDKITDGEVTTVGQRDKIILHLVKKYGILLDDLRADTLERCLEDDRMPEPLKELVRVRIVGAMASTAKYNRLIKCAGPDDRLRYTMQFCGADRTGRDAGRMFQPQNLPRPTMDPEDVELCIELIRSYEAEAVDLIAPGLKEACSNALRGLVIAPPGRKLIVSDWSNIEGRKAAWLAGEDWKLDAFRAFDAGDGEDLYKVAFAKAFRKPVEKVTKDDRQVGKVLELAFQYQGGAGACVSMAMSVGLNLEYLATEVPKAAPKKILEEAKGMWAWANRMKKTYGLTYEQFVAADTLKRLWRNAHPKIAAYWHALEDCAIKAVENPGMGFVVGKVEIVRRKNWLMITLPSGRTLMYPSPKIKPFREKHTTKEGKEEVTVRYSLTYMGRVNKRWKRIKTYGGKIFENITQASANDTLRWAMPLVEDAGYEIVLRVHDEFVTEVDDDDRHTLDELNKIMITEHPWAEGLPLAAAGFEAYRYRKD